MSELSDDIKHFIEEVAKNNAFTNFEIKIRGGTGKGDNYMGVVKFLTIKSKDSNKELDLVLKISQTSQPLEVPVSLRAMFLGEICMYKTVLPQLLSFQEEHNIEDPFRGVPAFFGHLDKEGSESLLLEDLSKSEYKMWDRKLPMNREHVEIVLKTYAKFHAISFAFKHFQPETFGELTKILRETFHKNLTGSGDEFKEKFKKIIVNNFKLGFTALGNHPAKEKLIQLQKDIAAILFDASKTNSSENIIIHGDCWCNNLLFQYKDITNIKKPTNVCLLDLQLCRASLPVNDIAQFLFVCTGKDILSDLDTYLNIYHESLSDNIRKFGCDPEKIYPYALFRQQWQAQAKLGLWYTFVYVPQSLAEFKDDINLAGMDNEQEELDESIREQFYKINSGINQRIYDVIMSMLDNKLI